MLNQSEKKHVFETYVVKVVRKICFKLGYKNIRLAVHFNCETLMEMLP